MRKLTFVRHCRYVIGSCIRHIPLAGRDITNFVQQLQRDRREPIPAQESLEVSVRFTDGRGGEDDLNAFETLGGKAHEGDALLRVSRYCEGVL